MLAELLATDGVEEDIELRSAKVGFLALHGGSLEVMTDVIASEAAALGGASLYSIRQPRSLRWHIPSNHMDPAQAPNLRRFLDHVDVVLALHGWGSDGMTRDPRPSMVHEPDPFRFGSDGTDRPLLLGGRNRDLAAALGARLREALPGYTVHDDLSAIPKRIQGMHPRNPVNMARAGGVQVELPPRVRGLPPFWPEGRRGRECPDVHTLIAALAGVVNDVGRRPERS
jgi:phage replication-related protein YjqB (UPF0714/DUF867 family)